MVAHRVKVPTANLAAAEEAEINSEVGTAEFMIVISAVHLSVHVFCKWFCSQTATCCCATIGRHRRRRQQHWMQKCCFPNLTGTINSSN